MINLLVSKPRRRADRVAHRKLATKSDRHLESRDLCHIKPSDATHPWGPSMT